MREDARLQLGGESGGTPIVLRPVVPDDAEALLALYRPIVLQTATRGRGLSKALYDRLLRAVAALGYCNAYAAIALPNDASIALHRGVGFEHVGVFRNVGRKFGRWHDVSWWQRRLRDEPPSEP